GQWPLRPQGVDGSAPRVLPRPRDVRVPGRRGAWEPRSDTLPLVLRRGGARGAREGVHRPLVSAADRRDRPGVDAPPLLAGSQPRAWDGGLRPDRRALARPRRAPLADA